MPVEGRGPELGAVRKGGRDLTTDGSLRGSAGSVRKLQNVLHAKAKEEPDRRFHALVDKVWRQDFLLEAWRMVRRNGGTAGADGGRRCRVSRRFGRVAGEWTKERLRHARWLSAGPDGYLGSLGVSVAVA